MAIDYNVTVGNAPDIAIDNRLHAYPQPVGNLLHVDLRHLASPTLRMVLTDIQGRKVIEQTVSGNGIAELSTADLPAGVYILQVETRKELATLKVIKTQD